jgi:predicted nucleic acid-binding protein
MSNVLVRDVPAEDLEQIREAAAARGVSLQNYLLEAVRAQARFLRRPDALNRTASRLRGRDGVPEDERAAVLDAIDTAHQTRGDQLGDRPSHGRMFTRAWSLARASLCYADAIYVAAAERHHTALLTADARIERSGAPVDCPIITITPSGSPDDDRDAGPL